MTAAELIAELQKMPPDVIVSVNGSENIKCILGFFTVRQTETESIEYPRVYIKLRK